ncbi:MAG: SAM-dependent methyltransferase [Gammaproteobacteria bacterium]
MKDQQDKPRPLNIIEIGAGIGTMIERFLDEDILANCHYTAIEMEPPFREVAFNRLKNWAMLNNFSYDEINKEKIVLTANGINLELNWVIADVLNYHEIAKKNTHDLLIGHAIIDLLPVPQCIPTLLDYLKPGGAFYFSLNFSGTTQFQPNHPYDKKISAAYHQDMDNRFSGLKWQPSQTGAVLGNWLTTQGHTIIEQGSSDWKLPLSDLAPDLNSLFINNILDTIENALKNLSGLDEWLVTRRLQLEAGELRLLVTNQDYFGFTMG